MKEEYVGYYKRMVIKANKEVVSPIEACMLDKKEALKKQAEDIIDLALGFECCPYCGNYKDIQNHYCPKCKKRIVMPDDAYWFSFYLKQLGGKGIKPKEK